MTRAAARLGCWVFCVMMLSWVQAAICRQLRLTVVRSCAARSGTECSLQPTISTQIMSPPPRPLSSSCAVCDGAWRRSGSGSTIASSFSVRQLLFDLPIPLVKLGQYTNYMEQLMLPQPENNSTPSQQSFVCWTVYLLGKYSILV